jgi:serine/threonine-protein kinase
VPIDQLAPGADGTALTQIGLVYGTPEYMPPEQAVGQEVDARADLYALGVMLHEMLAGERPFEAEDRLAILARQMEGAPPPLPAHVPASIATLVTRLLAKDAAARPASAREVIDALDAALGDAATEGLVAPARRASLTFRAVLGTVRSLDRRQRVAAAGVALFAVLALAFAFRPAAPHGGGARAERAAPVAPRVASSAERAAAEAGGAAALAALVERYPADTDLRRALVRAHLEAKQPAEVVRDVQAWVALDAAAIEDPDARAAVLAAARSEADGFDPAFELMEAGLGKDGPDLLYELSLAKGVPAKVAARALKSVGRADVRAKATPALAIALELRAPTACEPKRALLARARDEADGRSLPYLRAFTSTSGCGFLKLGDCWPCLRRDRALAEAIAEIEKRTAPR